MFSQSFCEPRSLPCGETYVGLPPAFTAETLAKWRGVPVQTVLGSRPIAAPAPAPTTSTSRWFADYRPSPPPPRPPKASGPSAHTSAVMQATVAATNAWPSAKVRPVPVVHLDLQQAGSGYTTMCCTKTCDLPTCQPLFPPMSVAAVLWSPRNALAIRRMLTAAGVVSVSPALVAAGTSLTCPCAVLGGNKDLCDRLLTFANDNRTVGLAFLGASDLDALNAMFVKETLDSQQSGAMEAALWRYGMEHGATRERAPLHVPFTEPWVPKDAVVLPFGQTVDAARIGATLARVSNGALCM